MRISGGVRSRVLAIAIVAAIAPIAAAGTSSFPQGRSVWDGIYTLEQAERGEPLYSKECARCHGPDLMGGEMAPALSGGEFVWNWNGLTVGALFERLRTSMPQDKPRSVSRQDKANILAFILFANEFPAGKTALKSRTEFLNQISFEAVKP
ncbi:MAG: c-type cytochrome [Gemmatimonadales bacterium]